MPSSGASGEGGSPRKVRRSEKDRDSGKRLSRRERREAARDEREALEVHAAYVEGDERPALRSTTPPKVQVLDSPQVLSDVGRCHGLAVA